MEILERSAAHLVLRLDSSLYSDGVVFKCFYWYGAEYDVVVIRPEEGFLKVTVAPKARSLSPADLEALESRIKRDLIDFATREIVSRETTTIRELLIAKAFAHGDEYDSAPPGSPTEFNR